MAKERSLQIYSNKQILSIAKEVSEKLNIPISAVVFAYKTYWDNIKEHIESLPLRDVRCDDDDMNYPFSYSISSIGKIYTTKEKVIAINKKRDNNENFKNKKSYPNG